MKDLRMQLLTFVVSCTKEESEHRMLSRRRHLTATTTIQFALLFVFEFCIPSEVKTTIPLISMRQIKQNLNDSSPCSQKVSSCKRPLVEATGKG